MVSKLSLCVLATAAMFGAPASYARDLSPGAAAAIGVLGGVALGGAIASGAGQGPYYPGRQVAGPPPVYVAPRPERIYVEEDPVETCYIRRRRVENEFGDVVIRRQRVCE